VIRGLPEETDPVATLLTRRRAKQSTDRAANTAAMDPRVREHSETLVDWSARVESGDRVVVVVDEGSHDLAVAVAAALGERGATPAFVYESDEVQRAYQLAAADAAGGPGGGSEPPAFDEPTHQLALYESADAVLALRGGRNTAEGSDVPGEVGAAYARANQAVREARMATDWVSTIHPTRSLAQQAGMSFDAYRDFAYGAILRDWASLAEEMAGLKELLDGGDEVRVVARGPADGATIDGTEDAPATDLTMSIEGRTAVNSAASVAYGSHNLPSGEVFTAPVFDSVEGEVVFDLPRTFGGTTIRDARLRFEDGGVADFSAAAGEAALADVLDTDDGSRRLGELGVGTNRGIDRVTGNLLFDEKMAGTVHLALGRAYADCLPEGETGNQSAVHVDLLVNMRRESGAAGVTRFEVDGEVVQRDGVFRWEDGFEG